VAFSLLQFSDVLKLRNAAGQPYLLIGGQAVNYWAERYLACEPELKPLQPFTSEDIDFKGGFEDVQRIARQLKLAAAYPHKVEMTALAGSIPFRISGGKSNIEVVRRIPGVRSSCPVHPVNPVAMPFPGSSGQDLQDSELQESPVVQTEASKDLINLPSLHQILGSGVNSQFVFKKPHI